MNLIHQPTIVMAFPERFSSAGLRRDLQLDFFLFHSHISLYLSKREVASHFKGYSSNQLEGLNFSTGCTFPFEGTPRAQHPSEAHAQVRIINDCGQNQALNTNYYGVIELSTRFELEDGPVRTSLKFVRNAATSPDYMFHDFSYERSDNYNADVNLLAVLGRPSPEYIGGLRTNLKAYLNILKEVTYGNPVDPRLPIDVRSIRPDVAGEVSTPTATRSSHVTPLFNRSSQPR